MKTVVTITLGMAIVVTAVFADSPRCSICNQNIEGKYVRYADGDLVCENCMNRVPRCDICGKPSLQNSLIDGKKVCRKCLPKLPVCGVCGKPIAGDHYRGQGNTAICPQCFLKADRCFVCGAIGNDLVAAGSKKACPSCAKRLNFCDICGEPISGTGFWFENDKSKQYCADCWNKFPHCSSCDAPVGPHGIDLDDGRSLCRNCYKAAIFQPETVTEIKLEVLAFLGSELGMELMHNVAYSLQGIDYIRSKAGENTGDLYGLFQREGDDFKIYVLYGLNRKMFYQVLAHEIAHAWLSERRADEPDRLTNEGFAQWVAYHALIKFGFTKEAEKLLDRVDDYALGLRKMLDLEKRDGRKEVFNRALAIDQDR